MSISTGKSNRKRDSLKVSPDIQAFHPSFARKKDRKPEPLQISSEIQTLNPSFISRNSSQGQIFNDLPTKTVSPKKSRYGPEIKMPQFKASNSNELIRIRRYFKSVVLFKDLPSNFIESVIKSSEFKTAQESEVLVHAETMVEKVFVIIKGSVQYSDKIFSFGSSLFAESLVVPEEVKSDVICLELTEYFVIFKQELEKVLRLYPNNKELIMKNYLEKNVSMNEFEIRLKANNRKTLGAKRPAKLNEKSQSLSKLNLKSLISSRTSLDIGLTSQKFYDSENPLTHKVKTEIEQLLKSADPFDFSLENVKSTQLSDSKFLELSHKVDSLYSLYEKELQLNKARLKLEVEAKEHLKSGFKSDIELIAMERESLRKIANSCVIEDDGENLWMYEHVKSLDRASEEIKNSLVVKSADIRQEIFSCQSTLQTFLNQSSQSLSILTIKNYRFFLNECELLKQYEDPFAIVHEMCGSYFSNASVKQLAEEVTNLMVLANKLKEALSNVIHAQEIDDTQQLIQVRQQLQDQGLLLSESHKSFHLFEKSLSP